MMMMTTQDDWCMSRGLCGFYIQIGLVLRADE